MLGLGLLLAACGSPEGEEEVFDPAVVRIVAIGDSITAGQCAYTDNRGDQVPGAQVYTYRFHLQDHIDAAGFELGVDYDFVGRNRGPFLGCGIIEPVLGNEATVSGSQPIPGFDDVQHEGWPGATAGLIATRLADGIGQPVPDIALLMVGTNDIFEIANLLELPWEPRPDQIVPVVEDFRAVIQSIRAINPDITILWAQIPPCGFESGFCANPIRPINLAIGDLAVEMSTPQSPIVPVDQFTGYDVSDLWDRIHPTDVGDRQIADRWWEALRPVLTEMVAEKAANS